MADLTRIAVYFGLFAIVIYLTRIYFQGGICESDARLDGKVVIVTGANTGIGKETVIDFIKRGARVIMACRSNERCHAAEKEVLKITQGSAALLSTSTLDLSSMATVRTFVADFKSREPKLHIIVNNAGVMLAPYSKTTDGLEMHMAVNHFGHFLLTVLLTDRLIASAPSRVVTVSSGAHKLSDINLDNMTPSEEEYNSLVAYAQSKQANIIFSAELGRRLHDSGVTTYSLHPGTISTELQRHSLVMDVLSRYIGWPFMKDVYHGAQTQICCAVDPRLANVTGRYYKNVHETEPTASTKSVEKGRALWELSISTTKLTIDEIHPKLR